MRIAVLGMGRMGQALAGRLIDEGHEVAIWNRTAGRAADLLDRGAREPGSIHAALEGVELVMSILANDQAVRDVAWGEGGIRSGLPSGCAYADCSTISPGLADELDDDFPRFVAMPILGSPSQVASGQASYLIGAADSVAGAVEPLFPGLSEKTFRYYRPSTASVAKVTVNLLLLDGVVALGEAFAVGRAGGRTDGQLRELLGSSPMVAPGLRYRFEGVLTGEQETFWTTALGAKDAGLAVDVAESAGVDLPVTAAVRDLYSQAADHADAEDIALVARRYRR